MTSVADSNYREEERKVLLSSTFGYHGIHIFQLCLQVMTCDHVTHASHRHHTKFKSFYWNNFPLHITNIVIMLLTPHIFMLHFAENFHLPKGSNA